MNHPLSSMTGASACACERRRSGLLLAVVAVGLACGALGWAGIAHFGRGSSREFAGRAFGADYHVSVVPRAALDRPLVQRTIAEVLDRVDRLMSSYRSDSDVGRLNAAPAGVWVPVAVETARAIETALDVGRRSGGAFDVTVGPLVDLWGFGPQGKGAGIPDAAAIAAARSRVGLEKLEVRLDPPAARTMAEGVQIDLSSVAEGYAADLVAAELERLGLSDYCVEVGGEIVARGTNARGLPWQLAVEVPDEQRRAVQRLVPLSGAALSTSGDYRNYYEEQGVRYCHILDPQTGAPVQHRLASATVIDTNAARADAWSTALMVMGPERGLEAARRAGLAALLIVHTPRGFQERWTEEFEKYR